MNNPINYIASLGESFKSSFNMNNTESEERINVFNLAQNSKYKTKAEFSIFPQAPLYSNNSANVKNFEEISNILKSSNGTTVYGFDIETFGSAINPSSELEKNSAIMSEFSLLKMNVEYDGVGKKFNTGSAEEVMNYTFGINNQQREALMDIIAKVKGGLDVTPTEFASFQNLLRYGGAKIGTSKGDEFFKLHKNGVYSIAKHSTITNQFDTDKAIMGLNNMTFIGKNQYIGTKKGDMLVNDMKSALGVLADSNAILTSYNGDTFDIPFMTTLFKQLGISDDIFKGMKSFDIFQGMNTASQFGLLDQVINLANKSGIDVPKENLGTLITQGEIRGLNFRDVAHQADIDSTNTLKVAFEGENSLFNIIENGMNSIKKIDIQTFNKNNVFQATKSLKIGSKSSRYDKIEYGVLDQYIEDGKSLNYFPVSTNRSNYYGIDDFGFIPKADLGEQALGYLSGESEGLYYMKLKNMASGVDKQAMLFRENMRDYEKIFQGNFKTYSYFPDDKFPMNSIDTVSQYDINKATMYYDIDNTRARYEKYKSPKGNHAINNIKKDIALYDYINGNYKNAMGSYGVDVDDLSKESVEGIFKGDSLKLSKINKNVKDISIDSIKEDLAPYGVTKADLKSFVTRYSRVQDEYKLNKAIIGHINTNLTADSLGLDIGMARDKNIMDTIHADAYNYINDNIKNLYMEDNMTSSKYSNYPENIRKSILENNYYGYKSMPTENANLDTVDLLKMKKEYLIDSYGVSSLKEIDSNNLYTRIDASNINDTATKIRKLASSTLGNKKLSKQQLIDSQKEYLLDLAYDFERRGVFDKGYNKKVRATDDVYNISLQMAKDLNEVVELAKSQFGKQDLMELNSLASNKAVNSYTDSVVGRRYANLTKQKIKTLNTDNHKINGVSVSNVAFDLINGKGSSVDDYINNGLSDYQAGLPKTFSYISKEKDFDSNKDLVSWFKKLGYSDRNIETFKNAIFNSKNSIGSSDANMAFHFYEKEVNGVNIPFMAISDKEANVLSPLVRGEQGQNAAHIMLPKVFNASSGDISNVVDSSTPNRFIQIGGSVKSIVNKQKVYNSEGALRMSEEDTIDEILNGYRIKRNEIKQDMKNKDYRRIERSMNRYSQRIQLDEVGVSPKVTTYNSDGTLGTKFVPRRSDFDLASKNVSDQLSKYIPYLYDYSIANRGKSAAIDKFVDSMINDFGDNYGDGYLGKTMDRIRSNVDSNKNYGFSNLPPDMQEFIRRYSVKDHQFLKAISEYANINKDEVGYKIVNRMIKNNAHSFTKDSHGAKHLIDEGRGVIETTGAHLSGTSRSVYIQSRGNIPFLYDEFEQNHRASVINDAIGEGLGEYDNLDVVKQLDNYGVKFSSNILSSSDSDYIRTMKQYDFNIINGLTANILQANPQTYLRDFNSISSNKTNMLNKYNEINALLDNKYSYEQFEEVFNLLTNNFTTYEQGGMLNPRMKFLYDKPQQFTATVGKEYYDYVTNELKNNTPLYLRSGDNLGYLDDNSNAKIFKGQSGIITGVEEVLGTEKKKYKIRYKHENQNLNNKVKLFTSYGEKGIFNIPDAGKDLNPLLYKLYDSFFGKDTFGVASYDLFKHNSYGSLAFSYLNTMFDEYSSDEKTLNGFVNKLNGLLPQYNFRTTFHPSTNLPQLIYDGSPTLEGEHTMYNAINSLLSDINSSDLDIDKRVKAKIDRMEKLGHIRTEIQTAPLEEGFGNSVKYEKRLSEILGSHADINLYSIFGDDAIKVSEDINKSLRSELTLSNSYRSGYEMLQNIKSTYSTLRGNELGIIKDIDINDIDIPHSMASYDEILDSIIFDFNQTNEYGAKVNGFRLNIPGGSTIDNPFIDGAEIDNIIIPLTKPYQADEYMLSNLQKKISSVVSDVKSMQYAYDNQDNSLYNDSLNKLNAHYKSTMASFYDEFTKKDGLIDKSLKTVQIDKGGFSMVSKIVEPLLDDKTGGFLDATGKNFWKNINGEAIFYDNVNFSEQAFNQSGIYFDDIGKQIYDNIDEYDGIMDKLNIEKINSVETVKRNLDEAEKALNGGRKLSGEAYRTLENSRAANRNILEGLYKSIGEDYLANEGIYSISGRYPFVKQDSVLVTKIFYDKTQTGNTFTATPLLSQKTKLDTDADMMAFIMNGLYDKQTGRLRLLSPKSHMYNVFGKIHEAQATGVGYNGNTFFSNKDIIMAMNYDRVKELDNGSIITSSNITGGNGNYLEMYKNKLEKNLSPGAKTILDFDNFFNSNIDTDMALKTISAKTSIGYISNDNFILRKLSGNKFSNREDLNKLNLIQYFTGQMEQGIFNAKHLFVNTKYKLTMGKKYRDSLAKMISNKVDESNEGLGELINIINELGLYKDAEGKVQNILPDNIYNATPTNTPEKTILAIKELLDDESTRKLRQDPMFWNNSNSEKASLKNIIAIFENGNTMDVGGDLGRDYRLFDDLDDFNAIELEGKKVGPGSYLQMDDGSEYAMTNLYKIHADDGIIDVLELKNQYGEGYELIGSSFDDISRNLKSSNAKLIEGFTQTEIENSILSDMFNSSDNFIRESMYINSLGTMNDKKSLNDSKKLNKKMNKVGKSMGLSKNSVSAMKENILNVGDSSTLRKYKSFHKEMYDLNKDIFDETYNVMNFLNETNLYSDSEVMSHTKRYYDDMVANLSNEMNDSIRKQALLVKKEALYKEVIPSHTYTSFDDYVSTINGRVDSKPVNYSDTYTRKPIGSTEYFNVSSKEKYRVNSKNDLLRLGDYSIEANGKVSTLNELTVKEIVDYVTSSQNTTSLDESQERAKNYILEHFRLSKQYGDSVSRSGDQMIKEISNSMTQAAVESAERLSKESSDRVGSKFLKESLDYIGKHKFVTAAMIMGAIGTVSAITDISSEKPLNVENMPSGGSPSSDGVYENKKAKKRVAPSSSGNNVYLKQNSNLNYDIEARNVGKNSNKNAIEKLKNFVSPGTNINVSERNDISNVSDSWIQEKLNNVL